MSNQNLSRMDAKLRDGFLAAAQGAAIDTRAHGLAVEQEALGVLKQNGVTVLECDREAFRKRVAPQYESFTKAHPESKPVIELIQSTTV
jgi:TRAP-type C4-dicarboxylate transport system substrate-binding protein